jgi:hypothetical protein
MKVMAADSFRRYKAKYAGTMAGEIEKNVSLEPGEEFLSWSLVREKKNWLLAEPRMLAITPKRIVLLEHNLFSADWIVEIPRSGVMRVSREEASGNSWVVLNYVAEGQWRDVRLQPMLRFVSEEANLELFEILDSFQRGETGKLAETSRVAPPAIA